MTQSFVLGVNAVAGGWFLVVVGVVVVIVFPIDIQFHFQQYFPFVLLYSLSPFSSLPSFIHYSSFLHALLIAKVFFFLFLYFLFYLHFFLIFYFVFHTKRQPKKQIFVQKIFSSISCYERKNPHTPFYTLNPWGKLCYTILYTEIKLYNLCFNVV